MDPNVRWFQICTAIAEEEWQHAVDGAEDLLGRLVEGGSYPEGLSAMSAIPVVEALRDYAEMRVAAQPD